jgi:hypothetical protein
VVRPKGAHKATIVWLHGLGDNGARYATNPSSGPFRVAAPLVGIDAFTHSVMTDGLSVRPAFLTNHSRRISSIFSMSLNQLYCRTLYVRHLTLVLFIS